LEDDVLVALDERAGGELGDRVAVQSPFIGQVEPAQVSTGVSQSGPPDQSLDLGVVERAVGLVDHELEAVFEAHPQDEVLVLGLDGLQQWGCAHLA
jgi:hypothetical protein